LNVLILLCSNHHVHQQIFHGHRLDHVLFHHVQKILDHHASLFPSATFLQNSRPTTLISLAAELKMMQQQQQHYLKKKHLSLISYHLLTMAEHDLH